MKDPPEWPKYLPPFPAPFPDRSVRFAPDQLLWINRTMAPQEPPCFDILDRSGRVIRRVVLPKQTVLLGFGRGSTLYAARTDADDLMYIQRYVLPR
jgi:hypothetical protein